MARKPHVDKGEQGINLPPPAVGQMVWDGTQFVPATEQRVMSLGVDSQGGAAVPYQLDGTLGTSPPKKAPSGKKKRPK